MFLSLAFLIASVVVYSSLIISSYENVGILRGQLFSKSDTITKYKTTVARVKNILSDVQGSSQVKTQVSAILPKEKDVSYFMGQIVGLSKINALTLESVATQLAPLQPSSSSVIKSIGQIRSEVKITGTYAGLKSFLRQIETNMLLMDVTDVRIEGIKSGVSAPLSAALNIASYYQGE